MHQLHPYQYAHTNWPSQPMPAVNLFPPMTSQYPPLQTYFNPYPPVSNINAPFQRNPLQVPVQSQAAQYPSYQPQPSWMQSNQHPQQASYTPSQPPPQYSYPQTSTYPATAQPRQYSSSAPSHPQQQPYPSYTPQSQPQYQPQTKPQPTYNPQPTARTHPRLKLNIAPKTSNTSQSSTQQPKSSKKRTRKTSDDGVKKRRRKKRDDGDRIERKGFSTGATKSAAITHNYSHGATHGRFDISKPAYQKNDLAVLHSQPHAHWKSRTQHLVDNPTDTAKVQHMSTNVEAFLNANAAEDERWGKRAPTADVPQKDIDYVRKQIKKSSSELTSAHKEFGDRLRANSPTPDRRRASGQALTNAMNNVYANVRNAGPHTTSNIPVSDDFHPDFEKRPGVAPDGTKYTHRLTKSNRTILRGIHSPPRAPVSPTGGHFVPQIGTPPRVEDVKPSHLELLRKGGTHKINVRGKVPYKVNQ